jgi:ribosomal protein S27AE
MKCPRCNVEYEKAKTDYEQFGIIVKDVEALRCPKCGDKVFIGDQVDRIQQSVWSLAPKVRIKRKVTKAAGKPTVYLPEDIIRDAKVKIGDEVYIYLQDRNRIVIEPAGK